MAADDSERAVVRADDAFGAIADLGKYLSAGMMATVPRCTELRRYIAADHSHSLRRQSSQSTVQSNHRPVCTGCKHCLNESTGTTHSSQHGKVQAQRHAPLALPRSSWRPRRATKVCSRCVYPCTGLRDCLRVYTSICRSCSARPYVVASSSHRVAERARARADRRAVAVACAMHSQSPKLSIHKHLK